MRALLFTAACFFAAPLFATVIVQKNGDVISGRILEEKADKYVFQSPYGKLQISKNNVAKLILDEKTIELKNVTVGDKTVKARLVNQDKNTSVYLTEDGRTIRKDEAEQKAPAPATPGETPAQPGKARDRLLFALSGHYGFSNYQQVETDAAGATGMPPFNQAMRAGNFGGQLTAHYTLSGYFGLGVSGNLYNWSGSVSLNANPPQQPLGQNVTTTNTALVVAPSLVFSVLGNLGGRSSAHDLRLEIQAGLAFNAANMDISFSGGATGTATASGRTRSLAMQTQLAYYYSFSESFRLRLGAGYFRSFADKLYDGTLQVNAAVGQFKNDFEKNLAASMTPAQVVSILIGFEIGF